MLVTLRFLREWADKILVTKKIHFSFDKRIQRAKKKSEQFSLSQELLTRNETPTIEHIEVTRIKTLAVIRTLLMKVII